VSLDLRARELSNAKLGAALRAIGVCPSLTALDLRSNVFNGDGLLLLVQACRYGLPNLATIQLDGATLRRDSMGAVRLSFVLQNWAPMLTHLSVASCDLGNKGAHVLEQALARGSLLRTLNVCSHSGGVGCESV
jgi:hypothetical protein